MILNNNSYLNLQQVKEKTFKLEREKKNWF